MYFGTIGFFIGGDPMQNMTQAEYKEFLMTGTRTGKLATVREDGRPHVAPIWFVLDGDTLVLTTWHESVKGINIRRNAHVSLCVDEETPPFAFVVVEGTAAISEDPAERLYWATRIAERYMGSALAESYGKRNSVEGELLIRIQPTKVIAQKELAA
jgi:PPOX class probable F420-dependent enzyme